MNKLTPEQYIKVAILKRATEFFDEFKLTEDLTTPEGVEAAWLRGEEGGYLQDAMEDMRSSGIETKLECEWSRHYESKAVAVELEGVWVGWTYWYGGGKYGEPEAIDWMDEAYFVECKEEEKLVVVREFKRI